MNEYTASNGIGVAVSDGHVKFTGKTPSSPVWFGEGEIQALREFFQAEADEQLGRWRWPYEGNRDMVAYPLRDNPNQARVLDESTGIAHVMCRDEQPERFVTAHTSAAAAYFAAHPEPKPWHTPTAGEVWVLTFSEEGGGGTFPYGFYNGEFRAAGHHTNDIDPLDPTIVAATRIYPPADPS